VTRTRIRLDPLRIDGHEVGRVLITGASAGIGAELARVFASHGHRLTLVARRGDKLAALAAELEREHNVDVQLIVQDLAKASGPGAVSTEKLVGLVDLNVRALTALTSLLLPGMVERGFGRVLNVASLAAFQPVPSMAAYAASKAYVLALSEALSEELKDTGVSVTALCPGLTDTAMVSEIKAGSAAAARVPKELVSAPADVAVAAYRALMAGRAVIVPGLPNQITAAWSQVTPRWLTRYVTGLAARQTDWFRSSS